ncbi:MAG: hypothetical protein RMI94_05280 [Bryobacterales bacterium]|nr:hypothetical protein [Bryobacteraceae bacterium]MDW8129941.1 hypothetical protein [Bryobacterales bacterium]
MKPALAILPAARIGRFVGAALIVILLALAGLLYSPWHRHNPAARQACVFSTFESSPTLEAGEHVQIQPVLWVIWLPQTGPPVCPQAPCFKPHCERAPPA